MDYVALASEINSDPKSIGYAEHAGQDAKIAELLNALTGPGAESINIPKLDKADFILGVFPAVSALNSATDAVKEKWDRFLGLVQSVPAVRVSDPRVQGALAGIIADGLMTQAQIDAFTKRTGSRAEVLFGAGTKITHYDVAKALRG